MVSEQKKKAVVARQRRRALGAVGVAIALATGMFGWLIPHQRAVIQKQDAEFKERRLRIEEEDRKFNEELKELERKHKEELKRDIEEAKKFNEELKDRMRKDMERTFQNRPPQLRKFFESPSPTNSPKKSVPQEKFIPQKNNIDNMHFSPQDIARIALNRRAGTRGGLSRCPRSALRARKH